MDEKEKKNEISVETARNLVDKSLELFDYSPLKNVKPDRTLQTGKRKISKVTNAFSKAVGIALDEPALGQNTDCLNCWQLVELIKEKLAITEDRGEIIILTIVPCNLSTSKVAEVFNISEQNARKARRLRLQKGILSMPEWKQSVGISQKTKQTVLVFYVSEEISHLLREKKDCVSIQLPDKTKMKKQKQLLLSNISEIYAQLEKENPERKIGFSTFALLCPKWCIPVGAASTNNVCVCTYHQNVKLTLAAMNLSHDYRQTMEMCVCDVDNYNCMMGHCDCLNPCVKAILEKRIIKNNRSWWDNSVQPMGQHW